VTVSPGHRPHPSGGSCRPRAGLGAHPTWDDLPPGARAFRLAHTAWALVSMASLSYIWWSAITRHRDRLLGAAVGFLGVEGLALVVGRGDCPFGPFQAGLGDPVPLFELVLPARAAKVAIPVLAGVTIAGIVAAAARGPAVPNPPRSEGGRS